jgi:hypothetical protein
MRFGSGANAVSVAAKTAAADTAPLLNRILQILSPFFLLVSVKIVGMSVVLFRSFIEKRGVRRWCGYGGAAPGIRGATHDVEVVLHILTNLQNVLFSSLR